MRSRKNIHSRRFSRFSLSALAGVLVFTLSPGADAASSSAYIRVSQVGYETANAPFQAYLMSTASESGATFSVINSEGTAVVPSTAIGALINTWSNKQVTYDVYSLSFSVPGGDIYYISVSGPVAATSPRFAVDTPNVLYPGLLLNTLWFYETQEDGPGYTPNALRTAPGHLNDASATVYNTPGLKANANSTIGSTPTAPPLSSTGTVINAAGGWWDAGDYIKYVETTSYTVALMEIGIRDFPRQMGVHAPAHPAAPPGCCGVGQTSVSYAGTAQGASASSDFDASAQFGINWLAEMWDDSTKTLYYQVDNGQDWDYYGEGYPTSAVDICPTYGDTTKLYSWPASTPYCLINEYDIWTLPQEGDNFSLPELFPASQNSTDNQPCDQYSTYFICNRPVFLAAPAGSPISPNLAGRMAAAFAEYYQLYRNSSTFCQLSACLDPNLALLYAEDIFALANTTSLADPAGLPWADSNDNNGTCPSKSGQSTCLLTAIPFNGYPETVWDDDMELGATELYIALQSAGGNLPSGLPVTNPMTYLTDAAQRASDYIAKIYNNNTGNGPYADTLNLYDVSGLAHFELYRALGLAGNPSGLAEDQATMLAQLDAQMEVAVKHAKEDVWGFGFPWGNESVPNLGNGDVTSHGAGLSVMASELHYLCSKSGITCINASNIYNTYSQKWLANILGTNAWGSSFIVGDGSTFPNCVHHQVANLAGSLDGISAGVPILWGAVVEGPAAPTPGTVTGMNLCSTEFDVNGTEETFAIFNGPNGAAYVDNVQSYANTEPGIDLTATSFLMFAWRMAGSPSSLP